MEPDYQHIADLAKHCDKEKLKIAESQAFEYDLPEILCNIWEDAKTDTRIKKIWALYSYARYVENSFYSDTASGMVRKNHPNSFPIQLNELQAVANQYRSMGEIEVKRYRRLLCEDSGGNCICDGGCDKSDGTRIFERKGKNIKRNDLLQTKRWR